MTKLALKSNATAAPDWIARSYLAVTLLACCLSFAQNTPPDPDLWGHVQYGEDALALGGLHQTATHTFTAVGHPWINHEILSEFALAIIANTCGAHGFIIGKSLLGLLVIGLMIRASLKQTIPITVTCICAVLTSLTLTAFWPVRPQLASYVGLALVIVVLNWCFDKWTVTHNANWLPLLLLPVIFCVWTNSHGGFVAGLCLTSAYFAVRSAELVWHHWRRNSASETQSEGSVNVGIGIGILAATTLACWLFSLINPYGYDLHRWMFESLGSPRPEISEWAPPRWSDPHFMPFALLSLLTWSSLLFTKLRRDPAQLLLLALCFWQATSHSRHIALFTILAGFWIPAHCASAMSRFAKRPKESTAARDEARTSKAPISWTNGLVYMAAITAILGLLSWRIVQRWTDFPVERAEYPVAAVQFIADEQLEGNLIVAFDWAQYALAALEPNIRVQFDGRFRTCYPQDVIDMHFDFLLGDVPNRHRAVESGPIEPTRILQHSNPNLVLIDRRFGHSVHVMEEQQADFCLLYQDGLAQVWGKRTLYDDPQSSHFIAKSHRHLSNDQQTGSVLWPAFPTEVPTEVAAN